MNEKLQKLKAKDTEEIEKVTKELFDHISSFAQLSIHLGRVDEVGLIQLGEKVAMALGTAYVKGSEMTMALFKEQMKIVEKDNG